MKNRLIILTVIHLMVLAAATSPAQRPDPTHLQLTFSGNVEDGAVSPDGRFLAYVESSATGDDRLFVRSLEGGEPRELARALHVFHLRWSPSSGSLLVGIESESGTEVRALPRDGGPGRTLEATRWFAWSPDESAYAFADYRPHSLFLRDLATDRVDTLALPGEFDTLLDLDWSPKDDRLAYVVRREPSHYEVRIIDTSGDGASRVAMDSVPLYSPRWSHDGRAVLYSRSPGGAGQEVVRVEAYPNDPNGAAPHLVARLGPAISFDLVDADSAISYIGTRGPTGLTLLDLETGASRPIVSGTGAVTDPMPSPDGREVAYFRLADGTIRLEIAPLSGGEPRTLVSTTGGICCPVWSPDGEEVAYASSTGTPRIWRVPSGGGVPTLLADDLRLRPVSLQWSPRDGLLAYADSAYGTPLLFWIDPVSGQELPFGRDRTLPILIAPRLSPDGSALAGWIGRDLVALSLRDASTHVIATDSPRMPIGWSSDGDAVFTYDYVESRIHRYSLSNGSAEVLGEVECAGAAILPDGRSLVCGTPAYASDLWIAGGLAH